MLLETWTELIPPGPASSMSLPHPDDPPQLHQVLVGGRSAGPSRGSLLLQVLSSGLLLCSRFWDTNSTSLRILLITFPAYLFFFLIVVKYT